MMISTSRGTAESMRALVLSGGGSAGSFQLGTLKHLLVDLKLEYQILCGISVGALNAVMLAQHPMGYITDGYDELVDIWSAISGDDTIWRHWTVPYLPGFLYRDSFYDSTPLQELCKKHVSDEKARSSGRKLRIGCVKYGDGEYIDATEKTPELWKWVAASSAFPGFFLPVRIGGELVIDGGARRITPLKAAIEAGATHIDVIVTSRLGTAAAIDAKDNFFGTKITGLKVAARAIDLMGTELFERDLLLCQLHNRLVTLAGPEADHGKRYVDVNVISPGRALVANSLRFDPDEIRAMADYGYEVAVDVFNKLSWRQ